ncbi:hypothetical protein U9M48_036332 [Paspalum notatum var. saurae]|uniref:CCHC-type domain-containing protein n=1 Tax=Paspalum notatum var. saurae TaxID=547442 RepID=A0AAQ3UH05_PASNO
MSLGISSPRHGFNSIRHQNSTLPRPLHRWRLRTCIGRYEIMKTRVTTPELESDQLYSSIWQMKKESIVESSGYETLTTDELYSKLKASEVDTQAQSRMSGPTPKSLALMSGPCSGGAAANANPSVGYALSLIAAKEEELEALDDDQLCLLSKKVQCIYSNRMSRRRGEKLQCYECGKTDHFIADCPQRRVQEKYSTGKSDHKYKGEYTSDKKNGKYKGNKKKQPYFSKREFARPTLLAKCDACPTLRKELEEVRAALRKSEKTGCVHVILAFLKLFWLLIDSFKMLLAFSNERLTV